MISKEVIRDATWPPRDESMYRPVRSLHLAPRPRFYFAPGKGAKYCDQRVCLFVYLLVCLSVRSHMSTKAQQVLR